MSVRSMPVPVQTAVARVDADKRPALMRAREVILEVAATDPRIGEIEETLRWGEPAYITTKARTGSTIRLGVEKASGAPAVFFNCKTTLVEEFQGQFGSALRYAKNRAVLVDDDGDAFEAALKSCVAAALTYHLKG